MAENGLFSGFARVFRDEVDSTMDWARRETDGGSFPDGVVCIAGHQSAGRGRVSGRTWFDQAGESLLCTVAVPVESFRGAGGTSPPPGEISLRTGLGIAQAIEQFVDRDIVQIKWPNDILITGKKVAGLLLEQTGTRVYIGFGINISQHEFPEEIRQRATALTRHTLRPPGPDQLVESVLHSISEAYRSARWLSDAEARLWSLGARVPFRASSFPFDVTGTIDGLERDGALRVTGVAEADRGGVRFPGAFPEPWLCYSGEILPAGWVRLNE